MAEARLLIRHAGPHVTIQDGGRPGLARFGVPASGAMDRPALALANAALGNPPGQAAIEVSAGGLVVELISGAVTLACAGGGFVLDLGGRRLGSWSVVTLNAGDRLAIRPGPWGMWTYLAVAGQLPAETWLGAQATLSTAGMGGGRLVAGAEMTLTGAETRPWREGPIPCPVWARPRAEVPVVMGPQDRYFAPDTRATLVEAPFRLTAAYDRMGVRLDGPRLPPEGALAIPSEPVLRGAIQVSGDGVPTVLLADHQTTGGYPKIATLPGPETDRFAQLRPGARFRFRAIPAEAATLMARQRAAMLARCLAGLAEPAR